jgi:hypothetical protein
MELFLVFVFISLAWAVIVPINQADKILTFRGIPGTPEPPQFPSSVGIDGVEDQVNVQQVIQSRLGTMYTQLADLCCDSSPCSGNVCRRSCPGNCWVTGWSTAPSIDIKSFTVDSTSPASYTPNLVVPQNYTNYSKKNSTTATFNYMQSFTDTVTVTNSQTLTISESINEKLQIDILSVDVTVGFSFSTTETESVTNTTTKQWSITFGPTPVPPCSGLYVECFILAANFNPTFSAVYSVDGTPTDECSGNWYWDAMSLTEYSEYNLCVNCNSVVCKTPPITFDNTIAVTGVWNGVFGAEVLCQDKPYALPPDQCSD